MHVPPSANAVAITLPVEGFVNVARLVTAGVGSQLAFSFEAIDDLQLAIELAIRSVPTDDGYATVALTSDDDGLSVTVTGSEGHPVDRQVPDGADGLDLLRVLGRLVDGVDVLDGATPSVMLRKNRATEVVPRT